LDCKKRICYRADRERRQISNPSQKALRDAAVLKAIKDGDIEDIGEFQEDPGLEMA
jgi:hypothetical protein